MSTQQTKLNNTEQQTLDEAAVVAGRDLELAYADALLDQVDTAQQQIWNIQNDIALLETMENALGLISENMARVRRVAMDMLRDNVTHAEMSIANDEIRNLTMIYMLIVEDTEFNGHFLFKDDVLKMRSCETEELTLTTVKIPEISGVETGNFQAILDSVDGIARIINRQYQRINTVMRILLNGYQLLRTEIELLFKAQKRLTNHQGH